ncbi:MAG: 1,4-dihydroxy-2-naphthoate octaprenyltransferase [Candidatus Marinimicrobia bacterium]|jgi:1,4-dihydroxy-2-naphthoate octaprenyltransferase|nr:1,4-dihydroxy-2-naphthoate octaprenyltransferase [Candidatus Neomarinimicrobiota bacterium]
MGKVSEFLKLWLKAYRAPFLTASIAPVILGTSVAWYETSQFNIIIAILAFFGAIFGHLGANIFNDYYDHLTGNDDNNPDFTPFSGGSRMIQRGILSPSQIACAGIAAFLVATLIGVILVIYTHNYALIIFGIIGIALGYLYTALPVKLVYRGLGELTIFLAFGPVTVAGAYFVQTGRLSPLIFLASIPAGLLVMLILYVNEILDENADRRADKNTIVVKIADPIRALRLYRIIMYIIAGWIITLSVVGYYPYFSLIVLILLPKFIRVIKLSKKPFSDIKEILPLSANTIGFQFLLTVVWAASFVLAGLFG